MVSKVSCHPSEDYSEFIREKNKETIEKGKKKAKKISICIIITIIVLIAIL